MSVIQYPETTIEDPDLQIWTNAVFDENQYSGESAAIKDSWCPLQRIFGNQSETTLDSNSYKENKTPALNKSLPSVNSPIPTKLLQSNTTGSNSQGKPLKLLFKQGLLSPTTTTTSMVSKIENKDSRSSNGNKIDTEMEEIEMEINRLSSKLEALRLEKAEQNLKTTENRGRFMPAKFMEPKQSNREKFHRRGVSLGPSEIVQGVRFRPVMKPQTQTTPIQSSQSRRKSCFWKLQEINEEKITKQRGGGGGRSLSLSPLACRPVSKQRASSKQQGFTTVGSKKPVKKEDGIMSSVQPKKLLFKEGEKSAGAKKTIRNGRVIASRYNQVPEQQQQQRKRMLSQNDKEENGKRIDKKRASSVGKSRTAFVPECNRGNVTESRVKKRWDIPSEVIRNRNTMTGSPTSILKMADLLPKIRTLRSTNDTPRDSGAAKKIAEIISKKSIFGAEMENSVCQVLNFEAE